MELLTDPAFSMSAVIIGVAFFVGCVAGRHSARQWFRGAIEGDLSPHKPHKNDAGEFPRLHNIPDGDDAA